MTNQVTDLCLKCTIVKRFFDFF